MQKTNLMLCAWISTVVTVSTLSAQEQPEYVSSMEKPCVTSAADFGDQPPSVDAITTEAGIPENVTKTPLITPDHLMGADVESIMPTHASVQMPEEGQDYPLDTGTYDGNGTTTTVVFEDAAAIHGVQWLRLYASEWNLGEASFLELVSVKDGDTQKTDNRTFAFWGGATAFFNGDAVQIRLHVAPHDHGVFVRFSGIMGGAWQMGMDFQLAAADERTLCGADDRGASGDSRVCRISNLFGANLVPGCTGWLVSNGAVLTAGHCVDFDPDGPGGMVPDGVVETSFLNGVIEFNVPASGCDGTPVLSTVANQYPIGGVRGFDYDGEGQGLGKDWAVFDVGNHPGSGDAPHVTRGFFRMTNFIPTLGNILRLTGFGTDNTPAGCMGATFNTQNQTNQTSTGSYFGVINPVGNDWFHSYAVDTEGGNSGSPIIWTNLDIALGIHTNGGCTTGGGANAGTAFTVSPLANSLHTFFGPIIRYVDANFPNGALVGTRDGTIYRPYASLFLAVLSNPANGTIAIVPGNYAENMTINMPVTLRAPCGGVSIGN